MHTHQLSGIGLTEGRLEMPGSEESSGHFPEFLEIAARLDGTLLELERELTTERRIDLHGQRGAGSLLHQTLQINREPLR